MANTRVTAADVQITGTLDMRLHEITGLETDLEHLPEVTRTRVHQRNM